MFIEAEKKQSTNNLTFNLRCHGSAVVRQWSFGSRQRGFQVPAVQNSQIMLTMEEAM
jgi:hypothetical protein